ncbi:hypothetical protein FDO65_08905 [Nakamurella flava]|uniref:Polysaccharide biosynthesis protein n=1 Tax=Nakamurella flava TaxID=2576308 RepID=A0A4U6QM35_9ACTN|nr:oligosaccharide flippase family protein [Nakamurella flava]TKV61654.1 hypothetical protein FDO65_08905 [Nakamurella flava]
MTTSRAEPVASERRLASGGAVLAVAMMAANAANYLLSLFLGRVLTPAEFSDANLMVTTLFSLTSIALCLQLVASRFIARCDALGVPGDGDALARRLRRLALLAGLVASAVLAVGSPGWSALFQTASPWPFVVLAAGVPFWLVQAVERGVLQARLRFVPLAVSFVVEAGTRIGLGVLLVWAGGGVPGATAALSASFVVTFVVVRIAARVRGARPTGAGVSPAEVRAYAGFVSVLLIGQIIANNSDIFVAKAFLSPTDAGVFAAVALIGRAVFFLTWSVVTVVFPVAARQQAAGRGMPGLLVKATAAVVAIGLLCTAAAWWVGGPVLETVLGPAYAGLSGAMAAYAGATTLFAIGNLVAAHRLSQSRVTESWLLLGAALLQVVLLLVWHRDMADLIAVQAVAMGCLVLVLAVRALPTLPYLSRSSTGARQEVTP